MTTFETRSRVTPDAKLHVTVPAALANADVRVIVEPVNGGPATRVQRTEALRRLAGSISDPTFERPPQGDFETRETLD